MFNLGLTRILGHCPSERLHDLLIEKLAEFDLVKEDVVAAIMDGAAVNKKLVRMIDMMPTHRRKFEYTSIFEELFLRQKINNNMLKIVTCITITHQTFTITQ